MSSSVFISHVCCDVSNIVPIRHCSLSTPIRSPFVSFEPLHLVPLNLLEQSAIDSCRDALKSTDRTILFMQ